MKTPPKLRTIKAPDLLTTLSADEIDLILAYRFAAKPYQMTILASVKRQAIKNKAARTPSLHLIAGGAQ